MSAVATLFGAERSAAVQDRPQPLRPEAASPVRISGLAKRFGGNGVLGHIDLTVEPGEFLAIVGRSGCGKTTLLRLIAGLETPSEGSIDFGEGKTVRRLMFQDARLLPWRRVLENVAIGRHEPGWQKRAAAALDRVGLADKAGEWPSTLSGGQRQRVALARALFSEPTLLLLDEPLGALDALTRLEMQSLIARMHREQGLTSILVTHDVTEAVRLADRVIVLENGAIGGSWQVKLPHPRARIDPDLSAIEAAILARLMGEG
jgi:sulfonate transport system ATP-binding protein